LGVHDQMPRRNRTLARVLSGTADLNIRFDELRHLLVALGFQERIRGSHHIFTRENVAEILNLQPREGAKAKPYQVRQVRDIVVRYRLAEELT
jgi:predicted RNA binding protein YcfA (HicA-like mRNA interferase family)